MLQSFFRFFAQRHLVANLITLMIILLGLNTLLSIKRDSYPHVDYGHMEITTVYPGASPEDVEINVTNKLEKELKTVTGIKHIVSISMENVSVISAEIEADVTDDKKVKFNIREAVNRVVDLPPEVRDAPLVEEINSAYIPVMELALKGDVPYRQLREYARELEHKLNEMPDIARLSKHGYRAREVRIEVDPEKVYQYQIPFSNIINAIRNRNIRSTAGTYESFTTEKNIVTIAEFVDPMEVGDVIIRSNYDSPLVKVTDVAEVHDDFVKETVRSHVNGEQALTMVVYKRESADVIRTAEAVTRFVERERQFMPPGMDLSVAADYSRYVKNRFRVVLTNAGMGLALVVLLLTVFLNLRSAMWVAIGIPVSLLGAVFLMPLFGVFLDSLTLSAMIMVLGIIVDDGIIISENIFKHREQGKSAIDAVVDGSTEVFWPVITTILTTFIAFAPMFFMEGLFGKFVFVIPLVISLALFISLFEVIVALPAHLMPGLQRHGAAASGDRNWFRPLERMFRRMLPGLLKARYAIVMLFLAGLISAGYLAYSQMKFVLMPSKMAEEFYVMAEVPKGTNLATTAQRFEQLEDLLDDLPDTEIVSYITRIGRNPFFGVESENHGFIIVNLTPFNERNRTADEIVESLRAQTRTMGDFVKVLYSIDTGGPPVGKPISLNIVGSDDDMRIGLANAVEEYLGTIKGVKDIDRSDKLGKDQIELKLDHERMARLGLTTSDVALNARIAFDGEIVTSVRYGDEDVDFRVINTAAARSDEKYLEGLLIPNNQGKLIPISRVATLTSTDGYSNYRHYQGKRVVTIRADVDKDIIAPADAVAMVKERFALEKDWPGMQFLEGGETFETTKSMRSLIRTFVIALVGIYFILIILFNSLWQPIIVISAIPFGFIGVILIFWLHQEPLSFLALMGVIGLSGVVVNDSLVLVSHINQIRKRKPGQSLLDTVCDGATERLRPIIMTTLTTVVGLLPLAYGLGGTDPFVAPMALALGWGLLFATPLTLILIPCFYLIQRDLGAY